MGGEQVSRRDATAPAVPAAWRRARQRGRTGSRPWAEVSRRWQARDWKVSRPGTGKPPRPGRPSPPAGLACSPSPAPGRTGRWPRALHPGPGPPWPPPPSCCSQPPLTSPPLHCLCRKLLPGTSQAPKFKTPQRQLFISQLKANLPLAFFKNSSGRSHRLPSSQYKPGLPSDHLLRPLQVQTRPRVASPPPHEPP